MYLRMAGCRSGRTSAEIVLTTCNPASTARDLAGCLNSLFSHLVGRLALTRTYLETAGAASAKLRWLLTTIDAISSAMLLMIFISGFAVGATSVFVDRAHYVAPHGR